MSLVHNERVKLTATYLNTGAGACFTAGVVAPLAAFAFGYSGPPSVAGELTFFLAILTFLIASFGLHAAARYILKGLRP